MSLKIPFIDLYFRNDMTENMTVARVITGISNNSSMVRRSETGELEGFCVDIWKRIASDLPLQSNISVVQSHPPMREMLSHLENDTGDVVMYQVTEGFRFFFLMHSNLFNVFNGV